MGEPGGAEAAVSARLLELAADDNAAGLGELLAAWPSLADEPAPWYTPARGAEPLTPLMVAAVYGSVGCLDALLSPPYLVDPNRASASSLSTPLHLAAAGGSASAPAAVSRLLAAGADPALLDHLQRRASDLVALPPNSLPLKNHLLSLLGARKDWPPGPLPPRIQERGLRLRRLQDVLVQGSTTTAACRAPEFKKGAGCRRGDMCEYAHGVFESWLHPAQYRTRLCKDGVGCARRVCFFAHTPDELRPLYVSTGSAVPSPRGALEMAAAAAAMGMGLSSPGSSSFTPPLSPSAGGGGGGGGGSGGGGAWPQQPSVPALCLPGSAGNLHLSRLRTSLSARDMAVDELLAAAAAAADYDGLVASPASIRSARGKALVPSNLDELFSAELAAAAASRSPRYADQGGAAFSPTRKATREKMQQQTLRSMSSRDLGNAASLLVGSPVSSSMSKWGFPSGNPDWGADDEELGRLKRCSSFELRSGAANGNHEPDLSWVNTLVKEPTPEKMMTTTSAMDSIGILGQNTSRDHIVGGEDDTAGVISSWLEQLQLDEMVV
ncbi:hypothetical protein OsJ_36284 [Oryza sativa Japonica Group]|uniref:C3H1-type domain-containing protein n=1 Tax=Oryza sativa subsp. japonica TaxID=39947 RepID=A3CHV6_ORYSJ|nr:hypothetical protein OsJ_36284 [Oryza sativa Japonica Group]